MMSALSLNFSVRAVTASENARHGRHLVSQLFLHGGQRSDLREQVRNGGLSAVDAIDGAKPLVSYRLPWWRHQR